jgi:hypothetical protein
MSDAQTTLALSLAWIVIAIALILSIAGFTRWARETKPRKTTLTVHSSATLPKTLVVGASTTTINPGETKKIDVTPNMTIFSLTKNYDGSITKNAIALGSLRGTASLFVTENAISSDRDVKIGNLINLSGFPVIFLEVGTDGRRWPKCLVLPDSKSMGVVLVKGTTWECVHPERENLILGTAKFVTGDIVFDGDRVFSG